MRHHPLVVIVLLSVAAGGCTRARANTEPVLPMLAPPPPPPRVIETYVDGPVPTVDPSPGDVALTTPPSRPAPRPPVRPEAAKPEPARTEPERPTTNAPALTLKAPPGAEAKTEASIRMLVTRATGNLQRVNYAALNADGRAQFDTCRRFIQQAEEALKSGNLSFAGKLADKAATMAAVLVR